nr:hypothetical protein [Tanacetum cinerariifolium]
MVYLSLEPPRTHLAPHRKEVFLLDQKGLVRMMILMTIRRNEGKMPCVTSNDATPKVSTCAKYAVDVQPIPLRQRNNRVVHHIYLNRLRDILDTLREIVKEARSKRHYDNNQDYACVYTKRSQELLENVSASCPKVDNKRDTIIATTPVTMKKHVTFADPLETSSNNPPKFAKQQTV